MSDQIARDSAMSVALANAAVWGHLLRAFVGRGIITEERVYQLLQQAEIDMLNLGTMPGAMGAGQVQHIRRDFEKKPETPPES